jgi:hypothetical protein
MMEHLPSKCEALSSNSSTTKKKKKEEARQKQAHSLTTERQLDGCILWED